MRWLALFLAAFYYASSVQAEVAVTEKVMQKGLFVKADCKPDQPAAGSNKEKPDKFDIDDNFDACACEADIRYPVISGLGDDSAQALLNDGFVHAAEQAKCPGDAALADREKKKNPSSASHHYEVTSQSPAVLGLKVTDWGYTGGAHGNGSVSGIIVDLQKGKVLSIADLFAVKDIPAVNQAIYDSLISRPEGEIFPDQVEARKGAFIKEGECQGCTLTLMRDGLHVLFQTYEVGAYSEGNIDVPVPMKYVNYAAIASAVKDQKSAASGKK